MTIKVQSGFSLIVILVLLVLITIIATIAIRQSILSLSIATNSQAQQLMTQNSDAATFHLEDRQNLVRNLARDGMFGFIKGANNKGKELIFCYRGSKEQFFNLSQASLIYAVDNNTVNNNAMGTSGYCRVSSSENFFTSHRRAVLTQISVSYLDTSEEDEPFKFNIRGTDEEIAKVEKMQPVIVNTISLMPTLSKASDHQINECLMNRLANTKNPNLSLGQCLTNLNVPFTIHTTLYELGQKIEG